MKKTFLMIAGAIALSLSTANAQEADRFVGAQHVKFQTACHPEDVKHYDTKMLRERFVMEKVNVARFHPAHLFTLRPFHLWWSDARQHHAEVGKLLGTGSGCR